MSRLRVHEHEISVAASADAVWRALTDAVAIGGWVGFDGGGTEAFIRACFLERVVVSDRPRHLLCGDRSGHFVEFFIAPGRETTQLRMVHSGELEGSDWDGIYDSEYVGWKGYLLNLRHYLERHAGVPKRSFLNGALTALAPDQAFARVTGPDGLGFASSPAGMAPGERFEVETAAGHALRGRVYSRTPGASHCALVIENLDDALLQVSAAWKGHEHRISASGRASEDGNTHVSLGGEPERSQVSMVLNTWGLDSAHYDELQRRTRRFFEALFPKDA